MAETKSTFAVKVGLAQMLKGGVIMDVVNEEQARIAEEAGAVAGARPRDTPRHAQQPPRRAMRHHNASANAASRATPVAPRALRGRAWRVAPDSVWAAF